MRMGRSGGLLVDGTAEEHLRIGALEDKVPCSANKNNSPIRKDKRPAISYKRSRQVLRGEMSLVVGWRSR